VEEPSPTILPLLFFSSVAQEVLPLTNLLSPQEKTFNLPSGKGKGKLTLATLKPPLSSPLIFCLASYNQIQENSRPGDASGFLESPISKR
jgi:hypothetical protein